MHNQLFNPYTKTKAIKFLTLGYQLTCYYAESEALIRINLIIERIFYTISIYTIVQFIWTSTFQKLTFINIHGLSCVYSIGLLYN